jgi:hypothetical protein
VLTILLVSAAAAAAAATAAAAAAESHGLRESPDAKTLDQPR